MTEPLLQRLDRIAPGVLTEKERDALAALFELGSYELAARRLGLTPEGVRYRERCAIRKLTAALDQQKEQTA